MTCVVDGLCDDDKEYKVRKIQDSTIYSMESKAGHLLGLYYLVNWEGYPKEENM